ASKICAWIRAVLHRDQVRSHMKRALDTANSERKCAAAVSECNAKRRKAVEHAAKNHRADGQRSLGGHTDEPGQPIFQHSLFAKHVPGNNKDSGEQFINSAPDRFK